MRSYLEGELQKKCLELYPHWPVKISLCRKKQADYSTDIFLRMAKQNDILAQDLIEKFKKHRNDWIGVKKIEIVPPGFINFYVEPLIQFQMISDAIRQLQTCHLRNVSMREGRLIVYAYQRIESVLSHENKAFKIAFEKESLFLEEEKIINCLDDLLSVFHMGSDVEVFKNLHDLAMNIHGYFNIITLLCENKSRYQFQMYLLKMCFLMLKKGLLTFGWHGHKSIIW